MSVIGFAFVTLASALISGHSARRQGRQAAAEARRIAAIKLAVAKIKGESSRVVGQIQSESARALGAAQMMSAEIQYNALSFGMESEAKKHLAISGANARLALMRGDDAIKLGNQLQGEVRKVTEVVLGSKRAEAAAQGLALGVGSPFDIRAQITDVSAQDTANIKINTIREVYGFKNIALNETLQGNLASSLSMYKATQAGTAGEYAVKRADINSKAASQLSSLWGDAQGQITILGGQAQYDYFNRRAQYFIDQGNATANDILMSSIVKAFGTYLSYGGRVSDTPDTSNNMSGQTIGSDIGSSSYWNTLGNVTG